VFPATHEAFWAEARISCGDGAGTRTLIEVLLLHRQLPAAAVVAGMKAALALGVTTPDLVAVEARRAASVAGLTANPTAASARVLTLPDRAGPAGPELPADERPVPTVVPYDQLLRHREGAAGDTTEGEAV
jgi:hypothetical protein